MQILRSPLLFVACLAFINVAPVPLHAAGTEFDPTVLWRDGHRSKMPVKEISRYAISMRRPEYPFEARRSKITGRGVCVISVDGSGAVTNAEMAPSTGSPILDNAATSAFRRWRFRPRIVSKVTLPISFTMEPFPFVRRYEAWRDGRGGTGNR
jgi:TonB family protein